MTGANDPKVEMLFEGTKSWWDVGEKRIVRAATALVPFGCPDWGERNGGTPMCTFCAIPLAVTWYRNQFYGGKPVPPEDLLSMFDSVLERIEGESPDIHTLMIYNGGSFLAMPPGLQQRIMRSAAALPSVSCVVIESRAALVAPDSLDGLCEILDAAGKKLTVRIGVETQDEHLRLTILRKGHTRAQLNSAIACMKRRGVVSGAYVLLNPAPGLRTQAAVDEAVKTISWVLEDGSGDLGMDETYFCSTNPAPGSRLEKEWRSGRFKPASLSMVLDVLQKTAAQFPGRVHMLPFRDNPELLAVPSNHVERGIAQDLHDAQGCDAAFHAMLQSYRETMDASLLRPPECFCRN
jgi:radical SAM enzyme (TIGR01210 family)